VQVFLKIMSRVLRKVILQQITQLDCINYISSTNSEERVSNNPSKRIVMHKLSKHHINTHTLQHNKVHPTEFNILAQLNIKANYRFSTQWLLKHISFLSCTSSGTPLSTLCSLNMTHAELIMNGEQRGRATVNTVRRQRNSHHSF